LNGGKAKNQVELQSVPVVILNAVESTTGYRTNSYEQKKG